MSGERNSLEAVARLVRGVDDYRRELTTAQRQVAAYGERLEHAEALLLKALRAEPHRRYVVDGQLVELVDGRIVRSPVEVASRGSKGV